MYQEFQQVHKRSCCVRLPSSVNCVDLTVGTCTSAQNQKYTIACIYKGLTNLASSNSLWAAMP